ncbi:hypothetical protein [Photobacterium lutimaris]|uniref:Sulfotransferase family protein n=1 Tax=Photobacterium lutimaris TaxID=388278 RepID=A0A2T3J2P7_9GAMM|nr:hypothetical protein [Photobacterium lutimaris]PSU35572.1 hypothetical protein C9I99_00690 [Photobacterium lutimaris]TDR78623.1 hypothetical protein DFP78_101135 [Photobacterium lutimaris]
MESVRDILLKTRLLTPSKHILLLSHMRANSTLIGHLLGSHRDVSGYYEMHIGYYSWKSLINQKLHFHQGDPGEPFTKYYFDKILHSEHHVNVDILSHDNVITLICLREPLQTINSIVKLYRSKHPDDDFTRPEFAARYYIERANTILCIAKKLVKQKESYYFYDAKDIIDKTQDILTDIQTYSGLKTPISTRYRKFDKTGARYFGDSSEYIHSGVVVKKTSETLNLDIDSELLDECNRVYRECREYLLEHAWTSCISQTA